MEITKVYVASKGAPFKSENCQAYGEYLSEIQKKEGIITPVIIVKKAKAKKSVLHNYFEWDNSIAGQKYRIHQARSLINHIEVKIIRENKPDEKIKMFHNIKVVPESKDRGYVSLQAVLDSPDYHNQVIAQALLEVTSWHHRYKQYLELSPIFNAIEDVKNILKVEKDITQNQKVVAA